jgi:hypothetical protein
MRSTLARAARVAAAASFLGVASVSAAAEPQDADALRAHLVRAIPRVIAARTAVAEFYVTHNRPPASLEEVGLAPSNRADAVDVSIQSAGVIRLALARRRDAPPLRVFFVPSLGERGFAWACISPDIPIIATILRDCRFDASFEPQRDTQASIEAPTLPNHLTITVEGQTFRIDPRDYLNGANATIDVATIPGLSAQGREQLVDFVLSRVEERITQLDDVLNLASWLQKLGASRRPLLERHLQDKPAIAAAALLALCGVDARLVPIREVQACLAVTRPDAAGAVEEINQRVERQLQDPIDHPHGAAGGILDCHAVVRVVVTLGAAARPVAPSLARLVGDRRAHVTAGGVDVCRQREVVVALLRVLLSEPPDADQADLADTAALALVTMTLFEPVHEVDAAPAGTGGLMDARDMHARLAARLSAQVGAWVGRCDQVQYSADRLISDLGVIGFDVLLPMLDARAGVPPCDPGSAAVRALGELVRAYPRAAAQRYAAANTVPTRDDLIAAALNLREAGNPELAADLDRLLTRAGVTAFEVRGGRVTFPAAPRLQWKPYDDWRIPLPGPPASSAGLQAAYLGFAQRWSECRVPIDDERIWLSVLQAKRLFVFACDEQEPALIVIGSPRGFKAMRIPDRLRGIATAPRDVIAGVSDVEGDGNLEVLIAVPCDGRDAACAEGRVPDSYELLQEDGDWFTWFRPRAPARLDPP